MNEDKATRYQRLKRHAALVSLAATSTLLVMFVSTGGSTWLRSAAQSGALFVPDDVRATVTVLLYVVALLGLTETISVPAAYYSGFVLETRYGLSNQPRHAWFRDQLKSFLLKVIVATTSAAILYGLIRRFPTGWWLPAGAIFSALIVALTGLAPVWLLPVFYRLKPLDRESLRARLLSLTDRAGARVLDVYEWGLGDKTRKANAALAGLWKSRRILVSDTMLTAYSDEEIEVVLAHEIAHHTHGDIWKGLLLESAVVFAGLFSASRALARVVQPLALEGPSDVAGLPVIVLSIGAVSCAAIPAAFAISRATERRADREALRLTQNPAAFISAISRLGSQSLAEQHPSRFVQWLFYSHPPVRDRIAAAQAFDAQGRHVGWVTRAV